MTSRHLREVNAYDIAREAALSENPRAVFEAIDALSSDHQKQIIQPPLSTPLFSAIKDFQRKRYFNANFLALYSYEELEVYGRTILAQVIEYEDFIQGQFEAIQIGEKEVE